MSLRAEYSDVGERHVVALAGSVDLATVPELNNVLTKALLDHPGETIVVDMDAVDSIDDVGLGVLLGVAGRARRGGGDLTVVCSNDGLRERLALTGFDRAITIQRSSTR